MSRTTDGGRTWKRMPAPADHVDQIQFFTANDGLAWGPGLYSTSDGGETWHDIHPSEPLQAVDAKDGIAWIIVSECPERNSCHLRLRVSLDYGKTWFDSLSLHDFATPDIGDGVMWLIERTCAPQQTLPCTSRLRVSKDKGRSWNYVDMAVPIQGSDYQLLRANATDAWILSHDTIQSESDDHAGQYEYYLISTGDGGRSWRVRSQPCPASMTGRGVGLPGGYIWLLCTGPFGQGVAQSKELYLSTDWGSQWDLHANSRSPNQIRGETNLEYRYAIADFGALTPNVAWMIYSQYLSEFTFDGGHSWVETGVADGGGGGMGPVLFVDSTHAWFGSRGAIYYSEDGGHTWTVVDL